MKPKTQATLTSAGWFPGRAVETRSYERALLSEGYAVSDSVRTFLREFGGLTVQFPTPRMPHMQTDFVLDPVAGVSAI